MPNPWWKDEARCKLVVDAFVAGHRGPLFSRWHVAPLAKQPIQSSIDNAHAYRIDFDVHCNNYSNPPRPLPATDPSRLFHLPLQLSMLWDSGDPDANHGWFAVVRDRVTGEEVALANGKAGDGETAILWTSEAHLERYQPWGDVPTSLWSRQIFQRNGKFFPDGGRGWLSKLRRPAKNEAEQREWDRILELERAAKVFSSVWFCGDSELERLVAIAANILEDDLPDANVPHEMFPVLWRAFLREAFKGTWFENLPLTALDVVALNLEDPVVYTKGLFDVSSSDADRSDDAEGEPMVFGETVDIEYFRANVFQFRMKTFTNGGLKKEDFEDIFGSS